MSLSPETGQGPLLEPCRILMWVTQDLEVIFPCHGNKSCCLISLC